MTPRGLACGSRHRRPAGRRRPGLAVLLATAVVWGLCPNAARAQGGLRARGSTIEEPEWLKIRLRDIKLGTRVEGSHEETTYDDSDRTTTYDRLFVGPTAGLGLSGSVYHPDFITFSLAAEGAYGWGRQETKSSTTRKVEEMQYFGRFRGQADILSRKALNGSVFYDYGRSYSEYDFFTRATVDTMGYGTRIAYREQPVFYGLLYTHRRSDVIDTVTPTTSDQDLVSFDAVRAHASGSSSFNYTYNQYHFTSSGTDADAADHSFTLGDSRRFGHDDQVSLRSGAAATHRVAAVAAEQNDQYSANADVGVEHPHNLSSTYSVSGNRSQSEGYASDNVAGSATLSHMLYRSLGSSLGVHGSVSESSADNSDGYSDSVGGTWAESYVKQLGVRHRLQLNSALSLDWTQEAGTGRARNERHALPRAPDTESFYLNQPNIDEDSLIIRDGNNIRTYVRGIDYEVFRSGSRTEIRRISGGAMPEGSLVAADYAAAPSAAGGYQTRTETYGARLDLWEQLWGIYGRMNLTRNDAPDAMQVPEMTSYTAGTDLRWRWTRAGAEYSVRNSDETSYRSERLYESASFSPDAESACGLDFSQALTEYVDADREEQDYRFLVRYRRLLTRRMVGSLHTGLNLRRGDRVDQDVAVIRPEIKYYIGQTTLEATYDYQYNRYRDTEERRKQRFMCSLTRTF